jgi:mRNA interferase HigB
LVLVHVISNKALREFASHCPEAAEPLQRWRKLMERGSFESFAVLKQVFGSVDKVGDYCVFDIGGNKYRVIAYVRFDWQHCYIKHMLTHHDYDRGDWR